MTWVGGFSTGALSESWGETLTLRVGGDWPPALIPLREASSCGATEERGRAKTLLSH